MSVCKKHLGDRRLRERVVTRYQKSLLTMGAIAKELSVTHATVAEILRRDIPAAELRSLKALKYSASKMGDKNPAKGKHPVNFIGDRSDAKGYLTRVVRGKPYFVHRIVMADLIGIPVEALPEDLEVHHIDEDGANNGPDNLALVTSLGHKNVHRRMRQDRMEYALRGLSLAEAVLLLTSK
jgi:hypothetical protein